MSTEAPPDIIEVIDDGIDPFGDRSAVNALKLQASRTTNNVFVSADQKAPVPVATGTDSASEPSTLEVAAQTFSNQQQSDQQQIVWHWDTNEFVWSPGDVAVINTVVDDRRTYVMAELPRTVAPTAQLQITLDALDPVVVPFNDADPDFDRTFAAYVFSEPSGYTAQIIGADGTVLAAWPSS